MTDPEITIEQVQGLDREIEELKREIARVEEKNRLSFPLDNTSKRVVESVIKDKIIDIVWEKFFNYFEVFTSLESLSSSLTGANSEFGFTGTSQPVFYLQAGSTNGDGILVGKHLFQQGFITFDNMQFFRTQFQLDSVSDVNANISVGPDGYGFKTVNSSLKGYLTDDSSNETTVDLQTISANTTYEVEVRFYPEDSVAIFFVDKEEKGRLTGGFPTGEHTNLWSLELEVTGATTVKMLVQTLELIQEKTDYNF